MKKRNSHRHFLPGLLFCFFFIFGLLPVFVNNHLEEMGREPIDNPMMVFFRSVLDRATAAPPADPVVADVDTSSVATVALDLQPVLPTP